MDQLRHTHPQPPDTIELESRKSAPAKESDGNRVLDYARPNWDQRKSLTKGQVIDGYFAAIILLPAVAIVTVSLSMVGGVVFPIIIIVGPSFLSLQISQRILDSLSLGHINGYALIAIVLAEVAGMYAIYWTLIVRSPRKLRMTLILLGLHFTCGVILWGLALLNVF